MPITDPAAREIEAEAAAALGADRHQRTTERRGHRNGSRERLLSTPAGDVQLRIPRFRTGSFFPSLLEARRQVDRALWVVVMETYVSGVSTRQVDGLVSALGCESGISKSEVSRICQWLDTQVQAFLNRPLENRYPYVCLDAMYPHGRDPARRQVISRAVIVATGSENEAFWTAFLRRLLERGLSGVQLVISDAQAGLKKAIARCCQATSWQRCRVHHCCAEGFAYARNLLFTMPKGSQDVARAPHQGGRRPPLGVRPAGRAGRGAAGGAGDRHAQRDISRRRCLDGPGKGGRAGLPVLPAGALAQDLEHQPPGAPERRTARCALQRSDQAPHPPGGCAAAGAAGGMAVRGRRVFSELSMAKLDNTSQTVQVKSTDTLAAAA